MSTQSNDPFPILPSENFFSQALDFMPVPMWIYDLQTLAFLEVNNAAINQYGYSKEEFLSMNLKDIRPDEDIEAFLDDVKNASYQLNKSGIWRHKRKNGEIIIVEIISHLITYGNIQARLVLANNVTERKQAEERNLALNEQLELLIRVIQELSMSPNLDSVMKTVRTSARKLVKADGSAFILMEGDSCYYADEDAILPLWKGERFPANVCISGWAMRNRKVAVVRDIYTDPRIPVEVYKGTFVKSLAMVPIRINNPIGAVGAYWSHYYSPSETELQLLQTLADAAARAVENIQLVESLEKRVAERTLQLESINKELETFTYSVSHDLKAPLRGIDGYSRLLLNLYFKELPEEAQSFLVNIRNSTMKMNQLIDDLLEYSRLDRSQVKKEKIRILDQINAVASIYKEELKADNIRFEVNVNDGMVLADEKGFTISLRNLVGNAIKFSKEKDKPVIGISMDEDQNNWILKVKDNGIGFDMKYHQKIYDIFQRLNRAEDYPGTGIGLALVQKAMQRMKGRVWAESTLGEGSTFYLELPKSG